MTPKQIQELRKSVAYLNRPGAAADEIVAAVQLEACADELERAQAGISALVVGIAEDARSNHIADVIAREGMADSVDDHDAMRAALQSVALALQGGRDAERWRHLRDGDCDMGDHHLVLARMYTGNNGEPELRCEVADYDEAIDAARAADLSRAIGDEK